MDFLKTDFCIFQIPPVQLFFSLAMYSSTIFWNAFLLHRQPSCQCWIIPLTCHIKKICNSRIYLLVESNKCLTASINSFTYKLHSLGHVLYILTSWYQGYQCFFQRKCKLESVPLTNLSYGLTSETSEIFFSFF